MKRQDSTVGATGRVAAGAAERPSRFYRFLLSIMGPPQLGSLDAPPRPAPPRVDICRRCGQPRDAHELERLADHTASRCPVEPVEPARS
ncbi:hypothetical protein ND748_04120 [Frankia sp. AiPs1]|uniref:hypothetical protein n=1 Tax=Frankia sp. AiPs1 TaxID=573493 RepID=UPI002043BB9C|nr:hypothetical protein [Frankia sp. AiPs1]MCM3920865.1 hypothetical protein [Frankia sp. AiPs1]